MAKFTKKGGRWVESLGLGRWNHFLAECEVSTLRLLSASSTKQPPGSLLNHGHFVILRSSGTLIEQGPGLSPRHDPS